MPARHQAPSHNCDPEELSKQHDYLQRKADVKWRSGSVLWPARLTGTFIRIRDRLHTPPPQRISTDPSFALAARSWIAIDPVCSAVKSWCSVASSRSPFSSRLKICSDSLRWLADTR